MDDNYLYCLKFYSKLVTEYKNRTLLGAVKYKETNDSRFLFTDGEQTHDVIYAMIMDLENDIKKYDPTFIGMG